jgi:hypothetical protein
MHASIRVTTSQSGYDVMPLTHAPAVASAICDRSMLLSVTN